MTILALLRHGPTAWTRAHRLQGRTDLPLDEAGRAVVAAWNLPGEVAGFRWVTSPLGRCVETAALLGLSATIEPRLIETDWGAWEGKRVADLRVQAGASFIAAEASGLDLAPPGGESPRAVQRRLIPLLAALAAAGAPTGAVTHKGVIRAVLALATDWNMTGKAPAKLDWDALHLFRLGADGTPAPERLNLPLGRS